MVYSVGLSGDKTEIPVDMDTTCPFPVYSHMPDEPPPTPEQSRIQSETLKLEAESKKLQAEARKLEAETHDLARTVWQRPATWVALGSGIVALVAGAITIPAGYFQRLKTISEQQATISQQAAEISRNAASMAKQQVESKELQLNALQKDYLEQQSQLKKLAEDEELTKRAVSQRQQQLLDVRKQLAAAGIQAYVDLVRGVEWRITVNQPIILKIIALLSQDDADKNSRIQLATHIAESNDLNLSERFLMTYCLWKSTKQDYWRRRMVDEATSQASSILWVGMVSVSYGAYEDRFVSVYDRGPTTRVEWGGLVFDQIRIRSDHVLLSGIKELPVADRVLIIAALTNACKQLSPPLQITGLYFATHFDIEATLEYRQAVREYLSEESRLDKEFLANFRSRKPEAGGRWVTSAQLWFIILAQQTRDHESGDILRPLWRGTIDYYDAATLRKGGPFDFADLESARSLGDKSLSEFAQLGTRYLTTNPRSVSLFCLEPVEELEHAPAEVIRKILTDTWVP